LWARGQRHINMLPGSPKNYTFTPIQLTFLQTAI
jgi:hypothetical protein